uniref:Uncharacterized protein n=1 Tax=Oryza sativa subsp. japonica TaxID=39947 RepID=Q2QUV4_ORYSJ|nr:hypothetical protein LOC_Os12g14972 [Oryza sativa Japonica Group]
MMLNPEGGRKIRQSEEKHVSIQESVVNFIKISVN